MKNTWLTKEMARTIAREWLSGEEGSALLRTQEALPDIPIIERRYYADSPPDALETRIMEQNALLAGQDALLTSANHLIADLTVERDALRERVATLEAQARTLTAAKD